ncbi:tRNA 2-thiouridine(34) synthase MnmA [candidate division WWE3 bacterium RIFCSPLOWO2_01_FULL_37_15]|uniref:tRNA-specific 2-thiouridylase MnmA n=1 Tax=candidate division WWE3 bacterium RIFCSPLOWO2_01_FULL_37_15 TaxID=1802622 RepID=A0A1F4UYZ4_UNCKA|nr:MAG: tRNA 2-thiouridine(34) synthase MnmA [candidate division WWE3 bacterium RIFCSPLOWO2_01_FULL_37_15]
MVNLSKNKLKVAVGLSGGVDSSVAAYLLKEQGYEVVGVHMQCWDQRGDGCTADRDRADAAEVAGILGIKFVVLDFVKEYKEKVINYFYSEYEKGRTPNPDVMCNKEIKFGMFLDWAVGAGFNYIATGHYARILNDSGVYKLLKGVDQSKDQSYFLYLLGQEQLSKTLFPVGDKHKKEVRAIAKKTGLPTHSKTDSVGICFIGDIDVKEFLKQRLPNKEGNVVNSKGEVIGKHEGIWFYTIGQRHGFSIDKYQGLPMYVIDKNVGKNELVVGFAKEAERKSFEVSDLHWIAEDLLRSHISISCDVRIRHLGDLYKAALSNGGENGKVLLEDSVFGVAPGQSAVFYIGDELVGGGIIK